MDRRLIKPSVRRCLFGRPTNSDDFFASQKKRETEEAAMFKRKWNLDGVENHIQWTVPDDVEAVPEFYRRGYSHKVCKRRPVRPRIEKSLSFDDPDHEDECGGGGGDSSSPSPVQYCGSSTVEVFIGVLPPHQSPSRRGEPPVTPKKDFDGSDSVTVTPTTENDSDAATAAAAAASVVSVTVKSLQTTEERKYQQTRLTDMWRVLKRPQRSLVSSQQPTRKRARIDRL